MTPRFIPHDHIISVGNICNSNCIYCAAKNSAEKEISYKHAQNIMDFITSLPLKSIYIEFTGGEPLLIISKLDKIVRYFINKAEIKGIKKYHISVVSNLTELDENAIKFILKNRITVCSSLDGPQWLHDSQRTGVKNSYQKVTSALKKLIYYSSKGIIETPNIITTLTKNSLPYYREIINEYIKHSVMRVQLGMIEPIGNAALTWEKNGINADEYIKFYERAFEEIIKINYDRKIPIYEKGYFLLLKSIKTAKYHPKRSIPFINRLSYDSKGNIYPDDESRMIGIETLKIGNVKDKAEIFFKSNKFKEIIKYVINNKYDKNCSKCPYSRYCYIPLWHRILFSDISTPSLTEKCKIFKFIFDLINQSQKDDKIKKITDRWLKIYV